MVITVLRGLTGEPLATLQLDGTFSIERLESELVSVAPLPSQSRYKFASEAGEMLRPVVQLRQLGEGRDLTLQSFVVPKIWGFAQAENSFSRSITFQPSELDSGCMVRAFCSEDARGGMAISAEAIPWRSGRAAFAVEILGMGTRGHEGLEIGITHRAPETFRAHPGYAVLSQPSWVSSDAGCLWQNGSKHYDLPGWATTTPFRLTAGDVVHFSLMANGDIEVHVNGRIQAEWPRTAHGAPEYPKPVYALVGLRAPLTGVALKLTDEAPAEFRPEELAADDK
ncbi:unnamed protein product [Symbiodinium natans]|uniref:NHR domain-containing protein n=1 Tax=Symbiodinium natans TaxID=878477 RepID=A0A812NP83_9DINO|nr:unnamed protein product [Symbiodinium natans]